MRLIWIRALTGLVWTQGLKYTSSIDAAFKEARKSNKPLWVMVSATWCGPCHWVEKNLFPQKWFDSLISQNFVAVKIYAASGKENTPGAEEFARKYRVGSYPTFLFLNEKGEEFYRAVGSPAAQSGEDAMVRAEWEQRVRQALRFRTELPAIRQKFEKGDRSPRVVRGYFQWALLSGDSATFHKAWEAYLQVFPSPRLAWLYEPRAYEQLLKAAFRLPAARTYALNLADTLKALLPEREWKEIYRQLVGTELTQYIQKARRAFKERELVPLLVHVAESTLVYARTFTVRFPFAETMALQAVAEMLLQNPEAEYQKAGFRYWLQYFALVKSIEPPDLEDREELATQLNNAAWGIYERSDNPTYLWTAVLWAKEALSYEPDSWHIWDTLGALYYKLKRKNEAVKALSRAISLAKSQGVSEAGYKETEELLQKARALE